MIEATHDHYTAREIWEAISSRFKRKPKPVEQVEVLQPAPTWSPRTELERTVFAALFLAGEPVGSWRATWKGRAGTTDTKKKTPPR